MYSRTTDKLKEIKEMVFGKKNSYHLDDREREDFRIVVDTLIYLTENISKDNTLIAALGKSAWAPLPKDLYKYAIIHLDNYTGTTSDERIKAVMSALPEQ